MGELLGLRPGPPADVSRASCGRVNELGPASSWPAASIRCGVASSRRRLLLPTWPLAISSSCRVRTLRDATILSHVPVRRPERRRALSHQGRGRRLQPRVQPVCTAAASVGDAGFDGSSRFPLRAAARLHNHPYAYFPRSLAPLGDAYRLARTLAGRGLALGGGALLLVAFGFVRI